TDRRAPECFVVVDARAAVSPRLFDGARPARGVRVVDQRGDRAALVEDTQAIDNSGYIARNAVPHSSDGCAGA
ncbi:MAG TPA: hypothetical protein VGR11_04175, partial [Solirubrobacteraceae bacterium]|nr:hypothetical protein [Solirubrobacteraceae bacterium]